ncbi:hypothetical protein GmRootV59_42790 [Variovorax sp. V59]
MKSNKQRRAEIRARRLERAAHIEAQMRKSNQLRASLRSPGFEPADVGVLERHNNTVGPLPTYYVDRAFICRECGSEEVWTAKQQKWWHEVVHGSIESCAVHCLACRRARRAAHAASRGGKERTEWAKCPSGCAFWPGLRLHRKRGRKLTWLWRASGGACAC